MLVTKKNFNDFLKAIRDEKELGFDTETTTLWWWKSEYIRITPRVFAMQFATKDCAWYLDFHHSGDRLDDGDIQTLKECVFLKSDITWYIANAKFDMHHCANHGIRFAGTVHCTKAIARIVNNLEPSLKLTDLCEKYLGQGKIELSFHKSKVKKWGQNDKYEDIAHFEQLPLGVLVEYGLRDTRLAYDLGKWQERELRRIDEKLKVELPGLTTKSILELLAKERELTKVLFEMERRGVKIDVNYTKAAYYHEIKQYEKYKAEFEKTCLDAIGKIIDISSPKQLKPLFEALNEPYSYTEKGNACFDADALERSQAPVAKLILKYRYHYKRAHTYFENFIWLADTDGVIHCDLQQAGTETGRMSCWAPNLQNVSKTADKEEKDFPVRKCFVPRPGFFFADLDYQAAEYRMMLDYANETALIEKVKAGFDVHDATKEEMGIESRHEAKTFNFAILYGAGLAKIGDMLGISPEAARVRKQRYFQKLNGVKRFIYNVRDAAERRGYTVNWAGRVLKYDQKTSFKAPNGLIQGGVGDLGKRAILEANALLSSAPFGAYLLLQVHDSLLFEVPLSCAFGLVDALKSRMEAVFPHKKLPMKVDGSFSEKSWSELVDEIPAL